MQEGLRVSNVKRTSFSYAVENEPTTSLSPPHTLVDLVSFSARAFDRAVELAWATGSELDNLGFHVYRALSEEGPYTRITSRAIPGLGSSPQGARYRYTDSGLENGRIYYYKLEDIETTGKKTLHGPVSGRPEAGLSQSPPSPDGAVYAAYGSRDAPVLTILHQTADEMVLELRTEGFSAEAVDDGSVRLSVPGFVLEPEAGHPEIPRFRSWLTAPAGRRVRITSIETEDVQVFSSLRPSLAGALEVVGSRQGAVQLASRPATASLPRGLYPRRIATVVSEAYQQDLKKALIELAPLRWDGNRGLLLARRLVVRLSFSGRERALQKPPRRTDVVRRLHVHDRGLYAVRFEDLWGTRRASVPTRSLRLSHQDRSVPFHVEPRGALFGPGSTLYFLTQGRSLNPYGDSAVYELENAPGLEMTTTSASPSGPGRDYYWQEVSKEENRYYQAGLLDAKDLWLWDILFAPAIKSFPFEIRDLGPAAESASLRVFLQGVSDLDGPDHHVRLFLNGSLVAESHFEGKLPEVLDAELLPGLLREGPNELQIENVGDTGVEYSMVMLDRFVLSYPRLLRAQEGKLEGGFTDSGVAEVPGLSSDALLLDITEPSKIWLDGARVGAVGLRFRADAGRRYFAVNKNAVLAPAVERRPASRLTSRLMRADYLVVGPRELLPAADPLLALRREQGFMSRAVPLDEIYSEFGHGEPRPRAIRDFLAYTYNAWRKPAPRYVLLLGDGTYDFQDFLKTGVRNQVPPFMARTCCLWTASDSAYASVHGDDLLPDIAIGRLPAASLAEARVMVAKTLAYESSATFSPGRIVLVADNPDDGGDFGASAEELAQGVLATRNPERIYLATLGPQATRAAITQAFDRGSALVSYVGHGGIHLWASENVFDTAQVGELRTQAQQPVVLTMNCLNGYFHFPYFNSLAEALVKAEGKGAIAAFSPSGLSLNAPAQTFHRALLEEILSGRHPTLGDAVLAAQAAYAASGEFPELLTIYNLLGDPALRLK